MSVVKGRQGRGGGPKTNSKTEREEYLAEVAKLDRRGYSQYEIARRLNRAQPSICTDLKIIRQRYKDTMLGAREEMVAEKLAQYAEIRQEAWEAYDRSKSDAQKQVEEFADGESPDDHGSLIYGETRIRRILTVEGRLPVNQYLSTIMSTLQAERELLGLDEYQGPDTVVNVNINIFDSIAQLAAQDDEDVVEAKILAVNGVPVEATPEQRESVGVE